MLTLTRKRRKKKYKVNWLDSVRKKRNIKVLYKKHAKKKKKPEK